MNDDEKMKMLFQEHHRHLSEIKQKVQGLTQRTITLLALATGWLILAKKPPDLVYLKFILILAFLLIGGASIFALNRFNKNYRKEAKIISKINRYFELFDDGRYINGVSIYPDSFKNFGDESVPYGTKHHYIAILDFHINNSPNNLS